MRCSQWLCFSTTPSLDLQVSLALTHAHHPRSVESACKGFEALDGDISHDLTHVLGFKDPSNVMTGRRVRKAIPRHSVYVPTPSPPPISSLRNEVIPSDLSTSAFANIVNSFVALYTIFPKRPFPQQKGLRSLLPSTISALS
jgi:hypothetical protein